jgi:predicted MFS family arabinose efflux permease
LPPERRLTAFALYRLAINVGFAAGAATAGLLAERSFLLLFVVEAVLLGRLRARGAPLPA